MHGFEAQHLSGLFDTDQTFARVVRLWGVWDIWEDLLDEIGGGSISESDVCVGNVEDVVALERGVFDRESETLGTVPSVNVAEAATTQSAGGDELV